MITILIDGVAYGMLLFILAMRARRHPRPHELRQPGARRLRHGRRLRHRSADQPRRTAVPRGPAACLAALLGVLLERTLYVHLYDRSPLDQVLFSIGLVLMAVAAVDYAMGSQQQFLTLPPALQGRIEVLGIGVGRYRLFIIVLCGVLTLLLQAMLARTRFGAQLKAAVDDRRVARGLGIDVGRVFAITFAAGSGLAGLGGALGAEVLGLDPTFPLKFMIYFLIVVTVGGTASITGPFLAALLLGIADVAGKYYVPALGAFIIYTVMIAALILRPHGLFARSR